MMEAKEAREHTEPTPGEWWVQEIRRGHIYECRINSTAESGTIWSVGKTYSLADAELICEAVNSATETSTS